MSRIHYPPAMQPATHSPLGMSLANTPVLVISRPMPQRPMRPRSRNMDRRKRYGMVFDTNPLYEVYEDGDDETLLVVSLALPTLGNSAAEQSQTAGLLARDVRAPGKLRIVEDSGECEATPGVYQASGYADLDENNSLWFWFFGAREEPETAPLTLWLQGGPGGSGLVGLYQEHGPCRIDNDTASVSYNPSFSWNNVSNMTYIDQPIPTGLSRGDRNLNNSYDAAQDFLQILFADGRFSRFQTNEFGIWTESYGGHFGPAFARRFLDNNAGVANGSIQGVPANLQVLGIGDGLTDPLVQYESYLPYAQFNPYFPTATNAIIASIDQSWFEEGGCRDQTIQCYETKDAQACAGAQLDCDANVAQRLVGARNQDNILAGVLDPPYPPDITNYANDTARKARIGAEGDFESVDSGVVNDGVKAVLYVGDADYLFNYFGIETILDQMDTKYSEEWAKQAFFNFTVHGEAAGLYKNAGQLHYLRVFGA
ncbi:Alpha/Beta hydrolase protein [Trametes elegans]|nr:Alpha/Beta hydrolase protein [Trametes elegans]